MEHVDRVTGERTVALGREATSLPKRAGVQGLGSATSLSQLTGAEVLAALGLG